MDELRFAIRRLLKRPASTLASVATLAGAIGAAAVMWSALSALLLRPLPVHDPASLFVVGSRPTRAVDSGRVTTTFVYPVYQRVRDGGAFASTSAHWRPSPMLVEVGGTAANVSVGFITHEFFGMAGIPIALGRGFTATEDRRGATPVALLTSHYWRAALGADPLVLGRILMLEGKAVTVVGVLAPSFKGLSLAEQVDLYVPFHTLDQIGRRPTNFFADQGTGYSPSSGTTIIGRIHEGITIPETVSRLNAVLPGTWIDQRSEATLTNINLAALPERTRSGTIQFSRHLGATVVLLLLIGCSAVGMLLLMRTEARRQELGICAALGASRPRLVAGIVIESAVLVLAGGALSVPVAAWLTGLLENFQLPGGISIEALDLSTSVQVIVATTAAAGFGIVLIAAIASSFAWRATAADARFTRTGATTRTRRGLRTALVAGQVAVALGLLSGAGVFVRSIVSALTLNGGDEMTRIVTSTINLGPHGYSPATAARFFDELRSRLIAQPSVAALSISTSGGGMSGPVEIDGQPRRFPSTVSEMGVDDQYFTAMNLGIVSGRQFDQRDARAGAPIAIISESFARAIGGEVIGRRLPIEVGRTDVANDGRVIVGVVSDLITNLAVLEPLTIYIPRDEKPAVLRRQLIARTSGDPEAAKRNILSAIREIDAAVIPGPVRSLDELIARQMAPQQLAATVLTALGIVAAFLTLLGTYVLADAMATSRMREMGIRAALGAQRRQLAGIVLGETSRLVGIGIVAGLGLAWLSAGTIRAFLFQVQPLDPLTLGTVAVSILVLALAVSARAALRVARVDLAQVLRAE